MKYKFLYWTKTSKKKYKFLNWKLYIATLNVNGRCHVDRLAVCRTWSARSARRRIYDPPPTSAVTESSGDLHFLFQNVPPPSTFLDGERRRDGRPRQSRSSSRETLSLSHTHFFNKGTYVTDWWQRYLQQALRARQSQLVREESIPATCSITSYSAPSYNCKYFLFFLPLFSIPSGRKT